MDKKKADQTTSHKCKSLPYSNSANAGQKKLLEGFKAYGQITTIFAREQLGVMHPASRVRELRQRGYEIVMHRVTTTGHDGREHRNVAKYSLIRGPV